MEGRKEKEKGRRKRKERKESKKKDKKWKGKDELAVSNTYCKICPHLVQISILLKRKDGRVDKER